MGTFKDKSGEKFGYLTVLNRAENIGAKVAWNCKCNCGNEIIRRSDALKATSMCPECDKLYRKGFLLNPLGEFHPSIKNEVNNRYGKLVVLEIDKEKSAERRGVAWKCQCDCGNITTVLGQSLRDGKTTSCGCNHIKLEEPGTKYGMLTIIERIENSNAGKARYLCKCDCGNTCKVVGGDLRSGQQFSCGCIKSKGEYEIIQILLQNNIKFEKEAKFDTCKDQRELPFDFKIIKNNNDFYLIEFDGNQHNNPEHAWDSFSYEKTEKHDIIKNQWCKDNNIPLIRIPYTHLNNLCIEDLLLETSQFIVQ